MALNEVILQGRIPSTDKIIYELLNGDDEKRAVLRGKISVQRSYKSKDDQYYEEDLLYFKAFGNTAIFIDKYFKRGDNLIIRGELRMDNNYTDPKTGEIKYGQMYVHVAPNGVYFQKGNDREKTATAATTAATSAKTNPLKAAAGGKPKTNPLLKRSLV